jgi:uncharacterized protein YciI
VERQSLFRQKVFLKFSSSVSIMPIAALYTGSLAPASSTPLSESIHTHSFLPPYPPFIINEIHESGNIGNLGKLNYKRVAFMFLLLLHYDKGLDLVEKHLEAHRKFLDKHYTMKHFICSGAKEPRTGGVILTAIHDRISLQPIIEEDPFFQSGAARYEIVEFVPTKYAEEFLPFLNT